MMLPDVEKVAAALQASEEETRTYAELSEPAKERLRVQVQSVYDAIAKVIAPEPVTPESERWQMPEPKASGRRPVPVGD